MNNKLAIATLAAVIVFGSANFFSGFLNCNGWAAWHNYLVDWNAEIQECYEWPGRSYFGSLKEADVDD